jgi:prefoldin beta subunit
MLIRAQEFAKLVGNAKIYKLVGPVLLKQDKNEAVMSVDARLEFIEKEM